MQFGKSNRDPDSRAKIAPLHSSIAVLRRQSILSRAAARQRGASAGGLVALHSTQWYFGRVREQLGTV